MNRDWKSYAELIGLTAVVASLIFVGIELRQSKAIAEAEMHANSLANVIEVRNAFIGNAEIWNRGNENDELTAAEERVYAQLVGIVNDRFYFGVQQQQALAFEEIAGLEVAVFAGFLHEHPRALQSWRSREERLARHRGMIHPDEAVTSEWVTRVESAIAVFERNADTDQ